MDVAVNACFSQSPAATGSVSLFSKQLGSEGPGYGEDLGGEIGHKKTPFQCRGQQANSIKNKLENLQPLYLPLRGHQCPGPVPITVPTVLMSGPLSTTPALRLRCVLRNAWLLANLGSGAGGKHGDLAGSQEIQVGSWLSWAWGPQL